MNTQVSETSRTTRQKKKRRKKGEREHDTMPVTCVEQERCAAAVTEKLGVHDLGRVMCKVSLTLPCGSLALPSFFPAGRAPCSRISCVASPRTPGSHQGRQAVSERVYPSVSQSVRQ